MTVWLVWAAVLQHSPLIPDASRQAAGLHGVALRRNSSDEELRARIHAIKRRSLSGGMDEAEYFHVMRYIRDNAPQRLLVWGMGYDSAAYEQLNEGGTTHFLEFDVSWIHKADVATRRLNFTTYSPRAWNTTVNTTEQFITHPHRAEEIGLLADRPCFHTIIVDSPFGYRLRDPGRAVPIFTAATDLRQCISLRRYPLDVNVTVFVHDCRRASEDLLSRTFLGTPVKESGHKKLREFRLH
ncbi:hypothetical protein AB1Y20_002181 [Prymnesium parvum]|uniref:Polysaccharide biosynthesis domain-containing protein n=1 Tax=Prymnesium parvum TaxID=97485 RepID=A0AB34J8N7_PRYPA